MKVYRFYIIKENERNDKNSYELYAVTKNKKLAKRFKSERDMNQFFTRDTHMDEDEYAEYINTRLGNVLGIYKLDTNGVDASGNICTKQVEVLATDYEHDVSTNTDVLGTFLTDEFFKGVPKVTVFNEAIQDALLTLEFKCMLKLYKQMYVGGFGDPPLYFDERNLFQFPEEREPVTFDTEFDYEDLYDYDTPDILSDQLGIFVANFYRTFKK